MPKPLNIALIGPYGAGKGTQAARMVPKMGLAHISTGDLFREHLKKQTELGRLIQKNLDAGELVPDSVTDATMEEWLRIADARKGILFDGFPRTLKQAQFLEELFAEINRRLDAVIYLKASDEEVVQRLAERKVCQNCHLPFHATFSPFAECPYGQCQGEHLRQREDDAPDKVRVRLQVYHQETEPLVGYYKDAEKLITIDASRPIDQVHNAIFQTVLSRVGSKDD